MIFAMGNAIDDLPPKLIRAIKDYAEEQRLLAPDVVVTRGSRNGDSFVAYVLRIVVTGTQADSSAAGKRILKLMAKVAPTNDFRRQMCCVPNLFRRESFVYNTLLPEFESFQRRLLSATFSERNYFKNYATCVASSTEPSSEFMLMEDLCEKGYQNFERTRGLDISSCKEILRNFARFHAISFVFIDKEPERFFSIIGDHLKETIFLDTASPDFEVGFQNTVNHAIDTIKTTTPEEGDDFMFEQLEQFKNGFSKLMRTCCTTKDHAVVCHGDSWISNLMYRLDNNKNMNVKFIDWQVSRFTTPFIDLSYFLVCCTEREVRSHMNELLNFYYAALVEEIELMGSDGRKLFPYTTFLEHSRKYMRFGLGMAFLTIHIITCEENEIPDFLNLTHARDIKKIEQQLFRLPAYIKRISDLCRDMVPFM